MNVTSSYLDEGLTFLYKEVIHYYLPEYFKQFEYTPWIFSLMGSIIIGLSGILPLLIIPTSLDNGNSSKNEKNDSGYTDPAESKSLRILLSFAVGGLLGDVFLHLLPEAWSSDIEQTHTGHPSLRSGLWVLTGVLIFTIVEKIFSGYTNADEDNPQPRCVEIANCLLRKKNGELLLDTKDCTLCCDIEDVSNGLARCLLERKKSLKELSTNNNDDDDNKSSISSKSSHSHIHKPKKVAGYLNLMANSIDNFTHGLAVAGSFLVSFRHGVLATFAILLHEIPHEVGDFAILLRSGFSRWDAARAQLLTASAGILGALVAIGGTGVTNAMEARTSWIMPFTAGGFLHISLVTVLPDLLKEEDPKESIKQLLSLIFGILVMYIMTIVFES